MIYEVQPINFSFLLCSGFLVLTFWVSKKIYLNEWLSKGFKNEVIATVVVVLGIIPFFGAWEHLSAYTSYIMGNYKTVTGGFIANNDRDGRRASIAIEGTQLNYHLYRSSCLGRKVNVREGSKIKIKYINKSDDTCILSVDYTE